MDGNAVVLTASFANFAFVVAVEYSAVGDVDPELFVDVRLAFGLSRGTNDG
jgi:hypothetical protein